MLLSDATCISGLLVVKVIVMASTTEGKTIDGQEKDESLQYLIFFVHILFIKATWVFTAVSESKAYTEFN